MIANFFQRLEHEGVAYLLISGQATVLHGAATFSEDIDLWIEPTSANAGAFLRALSASSARYYRLTPPMDMALLEGGHGFHYVLPDDPECYLDVMGRPPRVPCFAEARAQAPVFETSWGPIPTLGIRHLVSLKTTQRLGDYPIIGQLVLCYLERTPRPTEDDIRWALDNVYTVEDLHALLTAIGPRASPSDQPAVLEQYAKELRESGDTHPDTRDATEQWLTDRMMEARKSDRVYWRPIIDELRAMRSGGKLMTAGRSVIAPTGKM